MYNAKNVGFANLDIIAALSIEVQRANAENILQRLPRDNTLKVSEIRRCKLSAIEVREEARRRIEERKKNNLKDHWSPTVDKKDLEERKVDSEVHKQPSRGIKNRTSLNELNVKNVVTWELSDEEIDFEAHPHPLPILPQANDNRSNNTYVKGREQIRNLETSPDSDKHSLNPRPKPPWSAGGASGRFNSSSKQTWNTIQELNNGAVESDVTLEKLTQANQENKSTCREALRVMPTFEHAFSGNIDMETQSCNKNMLTS